MKWLEITLRVSGELAEPVADLLARHAHEGVVLDSEETIAGDAPVRVRAYIPVDGNHDAKRSQIDEGLWHLAQIEPLPSAHYQIVEEENWAEAWKAHYRPLKVGRRLLVQPAWLPKRTSERIPILLEPGMAFGTGTHPTTRMCLEAIEDHLTQGQSVFDLGCGSGILSIAAARLGARTVRAYDVDPEAIRACRQNAVRNGVSHVIRARQGSLNAALDDLTADGDRCDLIVANILASTLEEMLGQGLARFTEAGGRIILSGILDHQLEPLLVLAAGKGLQPAETRSEQDWRTIVLERKAPPKGRRETITHPMEDRSQG